MTRELDTAERQLAEGFAQHVARWAQAAGAPEASAHAAARAARAVSLATSQGHVCVALDVLDARGAIDAFETLHHQDPAPLDAAAWRRALETSGVVGTPERPDARPLILDADGRLYLHRHFDDEQRLARRLLRAARQVMPVAATSAAASTPGVESPAHPVQRGLFDDTPPADPQVDWQQIASAMALRSGLTVISGGPGTGKTTTVVQLLARLLEHDPHCRVALAAPTGKAAARMTEALHARAAHLPAALRQRLPKASFTVHRLLGVRADGGFRHDAAQPLPLDVLIVDEASMLDLALATRLLEAVPESARIVLLGDKDQLSAVEAGAVFAELCQDPGLTPLGVADLARLTGIPASRIVPPPALRPGALRDHVTWLLHSHRFAADSGIGRLARWVNAGDPEPALRWLRDGADAQVSWQIDEAASPGAGAVAAMSEGYEPFLQTVLHAPHDVAAIAQAFSAFRVLCAVRQGPRGVEAANARLEHLARQRLAALDTDPGSPWYAGRPVLVTRNDPALGLFNGDIGIALPDGLGRMRVHFADPSGGWRAIPTSRLPAHEAAFAMTVHKAQGSEFDRVLVMMPSGAARVLTRELLYTALTRARAQVVLCSGEDTLRAAIARGTQRRSGLAARLREAQAAVATDPAATAPGSAAPGSPAPGSPAPGSPGPGPAVPSAAAPAATAPTAPAKTPAAGPAPA